MAQINESFASARDILFRLHYFAPTTMSGNTHIHPVITQEHSPVLSQTTRVRVNTCLQNSQSAKMSAGILWSMV